jgi:hypothetical protein
MKLACRFAGIVCAALILIAIVSIARESLLLYHFDGYKPLDFRIEGRRREVNHETECYLVGSSGLEKLEFHVSPHQFERYAAGDRDGTTIRIWKNDMMPEIADITFQQQSLKVILDEDWRPYDELRSGVVASSGIAVILVVATIVLFRFGNSRGVRSDAVGWPDSQ